MDIPSFQEVVERYDLAYLAKGADLQLKDGDLTLTAHGDLQLGDRRFSGMHRLVMQWRFAEPTLRVLFVQCHEAGIRRSSTEMNLNIGASFGFPDDLVAAAFHEMRDSMGAEETTAAVFAGSIVVVLNNMLQRLRVEVGASSKIWSSIGSPVKGHSIGVILSAAAANFRHHDEWLRSPHPNPQQLASMTPLAAILGMRAPCVEEKHDLGRNICPEVLWTISDDSFDTLGELFFSYASSLASWNF